MDSRIDLGEYYACKLEEKLMDDMVYLFKGAFNADVSRNELIRRHMQCHGTHKYIGFVAYHKATNEAAAYYGVFPSYINSGGTKILAAQSGDTMTHPKHQKKGLFVLLAQQTYSYCRSIGINLIYGFPNANSYPGFMKHLAFTEAERMMNLQLHQNRLEISRLTGRFSALARLHNSFSCAILSMLFGKGEVFQNSNRFNNDLSFVEHDSVYAAQKESAEKMWLKIKGCNVFIKVSGNALLIGDIDTTDVATINAIVKSLKVTAIVAGLRFVMASMSKNAVLYPLLQLSSKNTSESNRVILLDLGSNIPFDSIAFLNSDIDVF